MANQITELSGIKAVIEFETKQGRTKCERVSKCGYDLVTSTIDGADERHIEVKATSKDRFTFRWLEELEQQAAWQDERFYLYLVTGAGTKKARVLIYDRTMLSERFSKVITHYQYVFPRSDFQ